jgi:NAD-dependent deacetylase
MSEDLAIMRAASVLASVDHVAVLTGAGVSKESGVPTFRDALDGLWAKYDPQQLATPMAFQENPKLVWDWYQYRRDLVKNAKPNPGHFALAELQKRLKKFTLITQNVDDLHEQAGSTEVVHLHGNIAQTKCSADCQGNPTVVDLTTIQYDPEDTPPKCPHCGKFLRPGVVWFYEDLPKRELELANAAAQACEVMLVVGTSGLVYPAANLPRKAQQTAHATVIEVNPDHSEISRIADLKLDGASGVILPALLAAMA